MAIRLEEVIPLGRSKGEYEKMFILTREELEGKILDCGGGPSSFNSEMTKENNSVVSIDPIYRYSAEEISERIDQTFERMMEQLERNRDKFIWKEISGVEELRGLRRNSMKEFVGDFERGKKEKRYLSAELPILPFFEKSFDLALCSHFLFLYSDQLSYEFHIKAIEEMLRVAKEVRIFPLVDLNGNSSLYVKKVINDLRLKGHKASIKKAGYEFQKGANKVLVIKN